LNWYERYNERKYKKGKTRFVLMYVAQFGVIGSLINFGSNMYLAKGEGYNPSPLTLIVSFGFYCLWGFIWGWFSWKDLDSKYSDKKSSPLL
jgi:hypothetical protein